MVEVKKSKTTKYCLGTFYLGYRLGFVALSNQNYYHLTSKCKTDYAEMLTFHIYFTDFVALY